MVLRKQVAELKGLLRRRVQEYCQEGWTEFQRDLFVRIIEEELDRFQVPLSPEKEDRLRATHLGREEFAVHGKAFPGYSKYSETHMTDTAAELRAWFLVGRIRSLVNAECLPAAEQQQLDEQIAQVFQEGIQQARGLFPRVPPEHLAAVARRYEQEAKEHSRDLAYPGLKAVLGPAELAAARERCLGEAERIAWSEAGPHPETPEAQSRMADWYFKGISVMLGGFGRIKVEMPRRYAHLIGEEVKRWHEDASRRAREAFAQMRQEAVANGAGPEIRAREVQSQLIEDGLQALPSGR